MKINLPIIGEIRTGKDTKQDVVEVIKEVEAKAKTITGSFLDFGTRDLIDETQVSSKVLEANKGWVYRNNDVIAKEVGNIEFELYKVRTVRDEVVYERIFSHPLLDALDKFNEFTSSYDGFYTTQSHRKLAGDAFWYVERTGLVINNIFILPPDKVTIDLGKAEGSQRIIQGYTYKDTIKGEPVEVKYKPEEIVHFRVPDPKNFYRGKSAVMAAAEAIDTDTMAIEANKKLFERGLIAQLMLTTDKSLTDEQLKQLHSEFKNTYGGVQNAYKVPIFGGGIKPENVQMSNKDAQFLEQQQWLRDKIMVIFGNTKAVLGITEDVNRANAEASLLSWMRSTVRPDMKGICDTLNEFLVPLYGDNLLLGFCDPVKEDESEHVNEVKALVDANIITTNEAREELGYDPIKGGDELRSEQPVLPPALRYVNTGKVVRKALSKAYQYKKLKEQATPLAKKMLKNKVSKDFTPRVLPDKMHQYTKRHRQIVTTAEKVFADKVVSFINRLVDKALDNVPNEVTDMQKKTLFNDADMIVEATLDFEPILMQVATQAGIEALKLVDSEQVYTPFEIQKTVRKRVEKFAESMVKTDKDKLIDIITEGVQGGSSIPEISGKIRDTFADYSKTQADRIVRTEVSSAASTAQIDAWGQSGVVVGKEWIVSDPCPECEPYDGKIVGLEKGFYGESEFADGDPPLHPNCKCDIIPVLEGELSVGSDIKIKRLQEKLEASVSKEELETTQKELDKAKKNEAKLKQQNKKLEQEKSELESFLDES